MGTEELGSGRSTDLEIAQGWWVAWLCCQAPFAFPFSSVPLCAEQMTQTAEGSSAVSSCEQLSWREPGLLPTQTVLGFCLLHWDNTHIVGPELCLCRGSEPRAAAWLCTALRGWEVQGKPILRQEIAQPPCQD